MSIEEDLKQALDVEPSPEFMARVRQRVAQEPIASAWWQLWRLVVAGCGALAVVVLAIVVGRTSIEEVPAVAGRDVPLASTPLRAPDAVSPLGVATVIRPEPVAPIEPSTPGVVPVLSIAEGAVGVQRDVEALRRFVVMVRTGDFTSALTEGTSALDGDPINVAAVTVEPLVIEPLGALVPLQGGL